MKEENARILYHYCSTETFHKIISNKSLRLCDITKSNDSEELKWIFTRFKQHFTSSYMQKNDAPNKGAAYERVLKYTDCFCQKSFICCFSAEEQKDSLSQWRRYAADGTGLSLGFDIKSIYNTSTSSLKLLKVEYDEKTQNDFIAQTVAKLLSSEMTDQDIFDALFALYEKAGTYKHPSFSEESESRLVYKTSLDMSNIGFNYELQSKARQSSERLPCSNLVRASLDSNIKISLEQGFNSDGLTLSPISTYICKGNLVSYFDLGFDNIKNTLIREIIIGPKCRLDRDDILLLLYSCGYSLDEMRDNGFKISTSKSTYV